MLSRCRLAIVTVRQGARLVAVWPLATSVRFGIRQLLWAGAPVSQYGDVLIEPGPDADEVITRSWGFLVAALAPDIVHLRKGRGDAAVDALVWRAGRHRLLPSAGGVDELRRAAGLCRLRAALLRQGAQEQVAPAASAGREGPRCVRSSPARSDRECARFARHRDEANLAAAAWHAVPGLE